MDALLFMVLALVLVVRVTSDKSPAPTAEEQVVICESEDVERVAKTNEFFYKDEDAFSEIIHALGFPKE